MLPIELALIVALFWADEQGWIPLSKTPLLFLVAWGSMRLRGVGWRDAGLTLPSRWRRLIAIGVAAGLAMWLLEFCVTMPLLKRVLGYWPDLSAFDELAGSVELLLVYLALNWVLAAFGEEMVWRGYALPRVAQFCGSGARSWVVALGGGQCRIRARALLSGTVRRHPGDRGRNNARYSLSGNRPQPGRADRRARDQQSDRFHGHVPGALSGRRRLSGAAQATCTLPPSSWIS